MLRRLTASGFWRSPGQLVLSGLGIALGVATLVFFVGLAAGARSVLLDEVFPLDLVEVAPRPSNINIGPLRLGLGSDTLGQSEIERLEESQGVVRVYPKVKLAVPALASGGESLLGAAIQTEIVADGLDSDAVAGEISGRYPFREVGELTGPSCTSDADCEGDSYCAAREDGAGRECRPIVPALASPLVVELYNGTFRRAYGLPQLNPEAAIGLSADVAFGGSTIAVSRSSHVIRRRVRLVGFSSKALPLGVTLPIGFVEAVNRELGASVPPGRYHSVLIELESKADVAQLSATAEALGCHLADRGARDVALATAIVMLVFAAIGGAIVAVATISMAHVLMMNVVNRQREIAILRATGATRGDVLGMILLEAALIGLSAGGAGVVCALVAGLAVDAAASIVVPDFPFKPESFFQFSWWLIAGSLALAVMAAVAGALIPARRAASASPARVLNGR